MSGTRYARCRQERLPLSELAAARACESCEDKGRRFALQDRSLLSQAIAARVESPQGYGVTDESAFKSQVRARMAETGEKYTVARRTVIEDTAIRDMLHREFDPAGACRIEIERTADRVRVNVHSARPGSVVGRRGEQADRIRDELVELTGRRVSLGIWELRGPDPAEQ